AVASNVNLGANAGVASTIQNNTNTRNTGTAGTDRGAVASNVNLGANAGVASTIQNTTDENST
ncbi:hypothetical protein AB0299_17415, partial [Pseudarthrobacter sp. NPDC080037]